MSFIDAHGQLYIPIVITDITVISLISLNSLKWDLAIWGPAKEILGKKGGQMAVLDKSVEEPVLSERESELVRSAQRCIMAALDHSRAGKIALLSDAEAVIDKDTPVLELPPKVLRFIAKTLGAMAEGKAILLMPKDQELTTVQAAHLLQVSRPFLSKLLKEGKIPFRMVGSHRRVSHEDLMAYKAKMREAQDLAMQDLTDQSQELGIE